MGKRYNAREREPLVAEVRTSGEPVKVVAKRLGVRESTAYYRVKRAAASRAPEVRPRGPDGTEPAASLSIDVGGVVIRVDAGFDGALLRDVASGCRQPRSRTQFVFVGKRGHSTLDRSVYGVPRDAVNG